MEEENPDHGENQESVESQFHLPSFTVEHDLKRREYEHDSLDHNYEHPAKKRIIEGAEQEAAEAIGAIVNSVDMLPVSVPLPQVVELDETAPRYTQVAGTDRGLEVLSHHHSLHDELDSGRLTHSESDHLQLMIGHPPGMSLPGGQHESHHDQLLVDSLLRRPGLPVDSKLDSDRAKNKLCNFGKFGAEYACDNPKLTKFPQCKEHYNLLQRVRRTFKIKEEEITAEMLNRCKNPKISGQKRTEKETPDGTQFFCRKCDNWKPQEAFHRDSRSFSGRQSICKQCKGSYNSPKPQLKGSDFFNHMYDMANKDDQKRNRVLLDGQHPITPQYIEQVASSQCHRCYFTHAALSYSLSARANQACLDRPFWKNAYSQGNVRLVCLPIFKIRSIATDDQIETLLQDCSIVELNDEWIPWTIPELTDPVIMVLNAITRKIWSKIGKDPLNTLNSGDIHGMILSHINHQKNRCRFSGLSFEWDLRSLKRPHLDRISPKRQYTIENTQLVIYPVVLMKRNLTEQDLVEFFNERKKHRVVEETPVDIPSWPTPSALQAMTHITNHQVNHLNMTNLVAPQAHLGSLAQNRGYQMPGELSSL